MRPDVRIGPIRARAYTIPTDVPEADGTFAWTSATLIVVEIEAGDRRGEHMLLPGAWTDLQAAGCGALRDMKSAA